MSGGVWKTGGLAEDLYEVLLRKKKKKKKKAWQVGEWQIQIKWYIHKVANTG